jgi:hypothetical protein
MAAQQGGLFELVARGKRDLFFTANPQVSMFHSVYRRTTPFTQETYVAQPKNNPEWGRWVEFDIEPRGDLLRKFYIRLTLPTWLPDPIASQNGRILVSDQNGVAYGYCNNVGFHMLEKIQLFQDQVLVQELYGEYLDWRLRQMNSVNTTFVIAASVGTRGESTLDVGRAATPGTLRIPIPLLGWESVGDPGFPIVAHKQRFRLRIQLRKLEDVVVASDGRAFPQPWNMPLKVQFRKDGPVDTTYKTLPMSALARGIGIALESEQVYVPRDVQEWLKIQRWDIPYRNVQRQEFTVEDNQWNAAATASVTNFTLPFRLDFVGPISRLLAGFQGEGSRQAGQRPSLLRDAARQFRLNIANIDRIQSFSAPVFRELNAYWKNIRAAQDLSDPQDPQEVFTFAFGERDSPQPMGTLNFSRSVLPELWITLGTIPIDTRTRLRKSYLVVYAESWKLWTLQDGKGMNLIDE